MFLQQQSNRKRIMKYYNNSGQADEHEVDDAVGNRKRDSSDKEVPLTAETQGHGSGESQAQVSIVPSSSSNTNISSNTNATISDSTNPITMTSTDSSSIHNFAKQQGPIPTNHSSSGQGQSTRLDFNYYPPFQFHTPILQQGQQGQQFMHEEWAPNPTSSVNSISPTFKRSTPFFSHQPTTLPMMAIEQDHPLHLAPPNIGSSTPTSGSNATRASYPSESMGTISNTSTSSSSGHRNSSKTKLIRTSSLPSHLTIQTPGGLHIHPGQLAGQMQDSSNISAGPSMGQTTNEQLAITVELQGNLQSMALNWTEEEKLNGRRLVSFKWFQQANQNNIKVTFEPVSQKDYHPDMTIVSCIYDDRQNFYLFTSVDFINFFESLAHSKFQIEEKNRIRRNLQSLKPLTITKANNKNLFSLIMSFGVPKPRNIEKNVKVFRWEAFQGALRKIASKYSLDIYDAEQYQPPPQIAFSHNPNDTSYGNLPLQFQLPHPSASTGANSLPQIFMPNISNINTQNTMTNDTTATNANMNPNHNNNHNTNASSPQYFPEDPLHKFYNNYPGNFPY